jgi:hypothetical protein
MRRNRKSDLTVGDRLVTGICGVLLGLFTGSFIWLIMSMKWRSPVFPYWIVLVFAGIMGPLGFVIGPQKMMDMFEKIWRRK